MLDAHVPAAYDTSEPRLLAKLSVPKLRGLVVPRIRLLDRLSQGTSGPLTVVCGPPGSGKTTLVASWVAHDLPTGRVAWLTLDEQDNQPGLFWTYVVEALRRHGVALPATLGHPVRPDMVDRSFVAALARALGRGESVVLVLDQFEAVTNPQILRDLDVVLTHAAPELRLVLTSRRPPGAPLGRYALRGELTEIGADELAFRTEEAAARVAQLEVN